MGSVIDAAFESRRPQGLAPHLSCFPQDNAAFAAITSKLDKHLQGEKERYTTSHRNKKRDMAGRLTSSYTSGEIPNA
jgi:hypothetical protein